MRLDLGSKKWAVFFWISALWCLGTIGLFIVIYTGESKSGNELIEATKVALLSLGGLGVILPTYLNVHSAIEAQSEAKLENTFSLIKRWDDPHLHEARKYTRRLKDREKQLSHEELIKEINDNEDLRHSVVLVMNYFDHVRISIKYRRVDRDLIKESIAPVVKSIHRRLHPFVESLDQEHKSHWEELQRLLDSND